MEESMEDLAMEGSKIERKARRAKEEKREKLRKLKRLAGLDQWENEDELIVSEAGDTLMDFLKFVKDPIVKAQFTSKDFKVINNSLVDAIRVLEKLELADESKLLKKV